MTETKRPHALEELVASALDAIPASPSRRNAMREELLAHLIGTYELELVESDHETALAAAKNRFGNLQVVSKELSQSVPLSERLIFQFLSPREHTMKLILRWILVGVACLAIGMGLILPALAKIKAGEKLTAGAAIPFAIGLAIAFVGVASSIYRVFKLSRNRTVTSR